jgi:hypothetical protein
VYSWKKPGVSANFLPGDWQDRGGWHAFSTPPVAIDEQVASGRCLGRRTLLEDVAVEDGGVPVRLFIRSAKG